MVGARAGGVVGKVRATNIVYYTCMLNDVNN